LNAGQPAQRVKLCSAARTLTPQRDSCCCSSAEPATPYNVGDCSAGPATLYNVGDILLKPESCRDLRHCHEIMRRVAAIGAVRYRDRPLSNWITKEPVRWYFCEDVETVPLNLLSKSVPSSTSVEAIWLRLSYLAI